MSIRLSVSYLSTFRMPLPRIEWPPMAAAGRSSTTAAAPLAVAAAGARTVLTAAVTHMGAQCPCLLPHSLTQPFLRSNHPRALACPSAPSKLRILVAGMSGGMKLNQGYPLDMGAPCSCCASAVVQQRDVAARLAVAGRQGLRGGGARRRVCGRRVQLPAHTSSSWRWRATQHGVCAALPLRYREVLDIAVDKCDDCCGCTALPAAHDPPAGRLSIPPTCQRDRQSIKALF